MWLFMYGGVLVYSWGVYFVEVCVDEDFGMVWVSWMVGVFDSGWFYNLRLVCS